MLQAGKALFEVGERNMQWRVASTAAVVALGVQYFLPFGMSPCRALSTRSGARPHLYPCMQASIPAGRGASCPSMHVRSRAARQRPSLLCPKSAHMSGNLEFGSVFILIFIFSFLYVSQLYCLVTRIRSTLDLNIAMSPSLPLLLCWYFRSIADGDTGYVPSKRTHTTQARS
ncbi:hypothetical protein EV127DRAFT_165981 [Xylaria flabelliformis]|nr:hypothetical protein EV127DRAFT_165981 [Xylaria flabelliformis]